MCGLWYVGVVVRVSAQAAWDHLGTHSHLSASSARVWNYYSKHLVAPAIYICTPLHISVQLRANKRDRGRISMGTDLDSVPENTGKVKKTKSKKTKYSDDALVEPTKVDPKGGDDAELKKEKKRKRKAEKVEEDDEKPKKSKKRKKEQNPLTVVEDGPAPTSPIDADSANPADRDSHESKEKKREKKKKDKKHKKDPEAAQMNLAKMKFGSRRTRRRNAEEIL
ncbi:hypothetical protein NLI96_g7841 [Meripilus lineatus]|uniref:Uncharacterized protein n=1 Tax=Meripilus lineatus TaxID=2056292 RepID=A0AAD5YEI7_9APHY|nr:hypothetical protein NLI96_g7841 [Physisporinus lineatus]